jgi:hypothetical protein
MKRRFCSIIAAVLLIACTGCEGFWDADTASTVTSTTLSSGYFYVLNSNTSQIMAFEIASGTLTKVGSYAPPDTPITLAIAPNNSFLLVSTPSGIYSYTISSGTLTLTSDLLTTDPAVAMRVDAKSKWLFETSATGHLYAIPVLAASGEMDSSRVQQDLVLSTTTVNQITVAPNDKYVFVACGSNGTLAYSFAPSGVSPLGSPAYQSIAPVSTSSGAALSVAVDPSTRLLYVGESAATSSGGGLRIFSIGTSGALTELSDSPLYSGGTAPYAILPISTGDFVYVANWKGSSRGNVTGFALSASDTTYTLSKLSSSVATGIQPTSLAEDSELNFVLAVSKSGSPYLSAYIFDSSTSGQLDTTVSSSTYATSLLVSEHD